MSTDPPTPGPPKPSESRGVTDPARLRAAIARIDAENSQDPNREIVDGREVPRELLYARRLTAWVEKLTPAPSEELLLAARAQHICRWTIPRDSFEMNRRGYLQWREKLKRLHAEKAGQILREAGYPEPTVARVQELIAKKHFPADPESRVLEDAVCLLFLETGFAEFARDKTEEKLTGIIRKVWRKMTPRARQIAHRIQGGPWFT